MSGQAGIKGSVFGGHAEILNKGLADGSVRRSKAERVFSPDELEIVTGPLIDARFYDIDLYARMLELLRDELGDGDNRYLIDAGRRTAERLLNAGIHQQFDYLKRTQHRERDDAKERSAAFGRDLRLLATITRSILNFAKSDVVPDPDHELRWIIRHSEAGPYPEVLCWTSQGFSDRMAEEHGDYDLWYWQRPERDIVLFRMNKDV